VAYPEAKAAATRAVELDDTLAEAHTSLGAVSLYYEWDWSAAGKEAQRAIELNPNYVGAHLVYSQYLAAVGQPDEAVTEIRRAQELDPLSPFINSNVIWILYLARQYDQAIEQGRKAIEMDPTYFIPYVNLGAAYEQKGMYEEAIAEFQKGRALSGDIPWVLMSLGYAYAVSGNRDEAQKMLSKLEELSTQTDVISEPGIIAVIYTGLGEKDQAFKWLEKAYEYRSSIMICLKVEPGWDSLRSDPRFTNLLRRVGLAA
jgi:tetratricopeptide (TPR) repeat protein